MHAHRVNLSRVGDISMRKHWNELKQTTQHSKLSAN